MAGNLCRNETASTGEVIYMYGEPMYELLNTEQVPIWKFVALYALVPILMGLVSFLLPKLIRRSIDG